MATRVLVYEYLSGGGWCDAAGGRPAAELLAQGRAMRDAMVADLLRAADCSVCTAVCEPGNTLPRGAVPRYARAGESAFECVARLGALHGCVWLVAPETDGVLARLQRAVAPTRWLGCSAPAIALASSKSATLAHLAAHGVQTPLAFEAAAGARRWVVKPDDGAGAVATRLHACRAEACADLAWRARAGAHATLEPWVEGQALSLSLLCTADRPAELLSINRQRIAVDARGLLAFEGVDVDAVRRDDPRWRPLAALATQVAQAVPGLHGVVGIDLVWHAQRGPVVVEINPRVTSAYVGLSAALGRNLAAELLAARHRCDRAREPEAARAHA